MSLCQVWHCSQMSCLCHSHCSQFSLLRLCIHLFRVIVGLDLVFTFPMSLCQTRPYVHWSMSFYLTLDFEFTCPVSLCQIRPCVRTERLTQHVTPDQTSWLRSEHPQSGTRSEAIRHAIEKVEAKDRNILDFINKVCVYLRHQTSFISVLCHWFVMSLTREVYNDDWRITHCNVTHTCLCVVCGSLVTN